MNRYDDYDDYVIEAKPVFTKHAKERLSQGRQGNFVVKKSNNQMVVVTVLPYGSNHDIPTIKPSKKQNITEQIKKRYMK